MRRIFLFLFLLISFWPLKSRAIGFQGIGGYPANPDSEDDLTKAWFTFEIDPGEKKEDALIVVNESEKAEKILLYPVDSTEDNLGGFALSKRGDEHNEIGSWVELGKNELVLSPGEKLKVSFTLRIPSGTSPGEYAGGIIIQKANSDKDPQTGFSINTRLGIRVYATVTGQIIRNLELLPLEIEKNRKDRKLRLGAILNNKGNVSVDADILIKIRKSLGFYKKDYILEKNVQILKGHKTKTLFSFPMPRMGNFTLQGLVEYQGKEGPEKLRTSSYSFQIIPWMEMQILFFGVILIGIVFYYYREKNKKMLQQTKSYEVKEGEDIAQIAEKFEMSWERLVKINRMQKPYTLNSGDIIDVLDKRKISQKMNGDEKKEESIFLNFNKNQVLIVLLVLLLILLSFPVGCELLEKGSHFSSNKKSLEISSKPYLTFEERPSEVFYGTDRIGITGGPVAQLDELDYQIKCLENGVRNNYEESFLFSPFSFLSNKWDKLFFIVSKNKTGERKERFKIDNISYVLNSLAHYPYRSVLISFHSLSD